MRSDSWTAERVELLRELWADGATAAAIADRLGGMTRSAVLGKVFRLRLRTEDPTPASQLKQCVAASVPGEKFAAPARRRRGGKRRKRSQPSPSAGRQHKSLLELTNNTCRWPHGRPGTSKFFFCGAPEADLERGIPYCARHMRRAFPACAGVAESRAAASVALQHLT